MRSREIRVKIVLKSNPLVPRSAALDRNDQGWREDTSLQTCNGKHFLVFFVYWFPFLGYYIFIVFEEFGAREFGANIGYKSEFHMPVWGITVTSMTVFLWSPAQSKVSGSQKIASTKLLFLTKSQYGLSCPNMHKQRRCEFMLQELIVPNRTFDL